MNRPATITFNGNTIDIIKKGLKLDNVQNIVFDRFLPIIESAIKTKKKQCIFCYVEDYSIIIPEKSYQNILRVLEEFYVKKEDYGKSALLRDLFNLLNEK